MAMTNIPLSFYRSTQAKFDALQAVQEGAFYLTTDTNRLYTGICKDPTNNPTVISKVELNQSITIYDSISVLTTAYDTNPTQFKDGQFYYSEAENVLVLFDSSDTQNPWKQINPDTNYYLTDFSTTPTINSEGIVTITTDGTNKKKNYQGLEITTNVPQPQESTYTIQGGTNVTTRLNQASTGIVIEGTEYQTALAYDNTNDTATLKLQKKGYGDATWSDVTSSSIAASSNVQINTENNVVSISATDTKLNSSGNNYIRFDSNGILSFQVTDTSTATAGSSTTPQIQYGHVDPANSGDPITYASTAKFDSVNGNIATLTLDTYNTAQINDMFAAKLRDFDAVRFMGQIVESTDIPTTARAGDMYVINTTSLTQNGEIWRSGDFIIATGQEETSGQNIGYIVGNNLDWILIPSGNDTIVSTDITGTDGGFYLTQNGANFNSYRTAGSGNIQVNTTTATEAVLKDANNQSLHKTLTTVSLVWQDLD